MHDCRLSTTGLKEFRMETNVKILIVGCFLGILALSFIFYSGELQARCETWSYGLENKYNTLSDQWESLSTKDPLGHDLAWEDMSNEWITYQRELYSYYGFCYFVDLLTEPADQFFRWYTSSGLMVIS